MNESEKAFGELVEMWNQSIREADRLQELERRLGEQVTSELLSLMVKHPDFKKGWTFYSNIDYDGGTIVKESGFLDAYLMEIVPSIDIGDSDPWYPSPPIPTGVAGTVIHWLVDSFHVSGSCDDLVELIQHFDLYVLAEEDYYQKMDEFNKLRAAQQRLSKTLMPF